MPYSCGLYQRTRNLAFPYIGQDGWNEDGTRAVMEIPTFESAKLCRYDKRGVDSNCKNCTRVTDTEYLTKQGLM